MDLVDEVNVGWERVRGARLRLRPGIFGLAENVKGIV